MKCEWAIQETDWLGHWLTPIDIKPWRKKINAIIALKSSKNLRELRKFLQAVNFNKDMWKRRSHFQQPLTDLIGERKHVWLDINEKAFNKIKSILSTDALLYYPDHNKRFDIWTDSSDYLLGSTIGERDDEGTFRTVAFFSKKLNKARRNYSTGEKECISIYENLKTYRTMLLGAEIHIFTDHKKNSLTIV